MHSAIDIKGETPMKVIQKIKGILFSLPILCLPSVALASYAYTQSHSGEGSLGLVGLVLFGSLTGILVLGNTSQDR